MALAAMSMAGILLCAATWSRNLAPTQPAPALSVASPLRLYGSMTKHGPVVGLSQLASLFQAGNTTSARLAGQLYYPHSWRTQRLLGRRPEVRPKPNVLDLSPSSACCLPLCRILHATSAHCVTPFSHLFAA
jgi:hypothetical protein